jgi:hypothetical protein
MLRPRGSARPTRPTLAAFPNTVMLAAAVGRHAAQTIIAGDRAIVLCALTRRSHVPRCRIAGRCSPMRRASIPTALQISSPTSRRISLISSGQRIVHLPECRIVEPARMAQPRSKARQRSDNLNRKRLRVLASRLNSPDGRKLLQSHLMSPDSPKGSQARTTFCGSTQRCASRRLMGREGVASGVY